MSRKALSTARPRSARAWFRVSTFPLLMMPSRMWPCTAAKCSDDSCALINTTMKVVATAISIETNSKMRTILP
jgi:hypothetical protein